MEEFFTSLSKRQTMLLLTAVTFGGQDAVAALDFLPEEEAALLKHRAGEMLQIAREKRIPLLVQEIKRLVTARRGALWAADPMKLAEVLVKERASVVELLLRAFPETLAEAVRMHLPRTGHPVKRDVRPEIVGILRWKLEEVLERAGARRAHFKFSDVLLLSPRELLTLCDHLGARVLGPALAGLGPADRDSFLNGLPPDQRQLSAKYIAAAAQRHLDEKDAQDVLLLHNSQKGASEAIRSAGAQRLARACLAQSAEFAARLLERYRGEFGALLGKWVREERQRAVHRGDGGRSDIVLEMERLEQKGMLAKPVRLMPPPKRVAAPAPARPALPEPNSKVSPSRKPTGSLPPPASREMRALGGPPASTTRDWVAEREARKAGMPPRKDELPRRDPVAERAARRAGAINSAKRRPPDPEDPAEVTNPLPEDERPVRTDPVREPPARKGGDGTNVARPPRARGENAVPHRSKPRGPKDG